MGSRRLWLGSCAAILVSLLILGSYAGYRAQRLLEQQRISLDWQQLSLSPRGLRLEGFSLQQQGDSGHLQLLGSRLQLYWLASEGPRYRLVLEDPLLDWQAGQSAADQPPGDLRALLERFGTALPWLPRRIELRRAEAQLPCASGRCSLRGEATLQQQDAGLRLDAALLHGSHRAELRAELHAPIADGPLQVDAELRLDDEPQLQLASEVRTLAGATQWSGRLSMPRLGDVAWFGDWLSQWLLIDPRPLPATPQQARLEAQWQVQLAPGPWQAADLLAAPGWLRLDALLQQPWPLPALGLLQGELALDLHNGNGRWQARELRADLALDARAAPWLAALPGELRPEQLQLKIAPGTSEAMPADALAMQVQLQVQGPLRVQGEAELALQLQTDWALQIPRLQLDARAPSVQLAGNRLDGLQLALRLSGQADAQRLDLRLGDSHLAVERLRVGDLQLQGVTGELGDIRLRGTPQAPQLGGPLTLRTQRLQHPQLQAQGWQWQGQLQASGEQQNLVGTLLADSGLHLALRLARDAQGEARATAKLEELFLRAGNPLPQTLSDWPALLSLDNGRLQGEAHLRLPPGQPLQAQLTLNGNGLAGIYDRSTFTGVEGALQLAIIGNRLELELPQLSARQIDPGIALGPLHLQARYQAALARPLSGLLSHQRAELGVLGGNLSLAPDEWRLDRPRQLLPLRLSGLDLQQLFRVYPAEGLEGSGLLDGVIPLRLDGQGLSVEDGHIEARPPGGRLRFHSPRIQAMGQANPAMKLVTDALEDFHYDHLGSSLDYDRAGTLRLGMRLEGRNPTIEQGRPIHFNINLEEDIPALLASLQLTAKVSEIIQQRIQQRMRQRVPQQTKE